MAATPSPALPLGPVIPHRLDKHLRDCIRQSVPLVRSLIAQGEVSVSGQRVVEPEHLVYAGEEVRLRGHRLEPQTEHHTAMLNKPLNVTCTVRDPRGGGDLSQYLKQLPPGSFPIGRLDRDTTGLYLFSTDGDLSNVILRPEQHTQKEYRLRLSIAVSPDDARLAALTEGIDLNGHLARAVRVTITGQSSAGTELAMVLREGRNRQIRKMCRRQNLHLVELHRTSVGSLRLGELAEGQMRMLASHEVEALWHSTGGRARLRQRKLLALHRLAATARANSQPLLRLESWLSMHG